VVLEWKCELSATNSVYTWGRRRGMLKEAESVLLPSDSRPIWELHALLPTRKEGLVRRFHHGDSG
jgi:hypothetical protein